MLSSWMLRSLRRAFVRDTDLWIAFATGVLLRVQYVLSTPHSVRGHDVTGHMEYIVYMMKNTAIPLFTDGWEMHQAPLYYILASLWAQAALLLGRLPETMWTDLQLLSLFLSVLTLGISFWITKLLFPRRDKHIQALLFFGMLAALPGIVFISSRVSNDPLLTALMFALVGALIEWWRSGEDRWWYACIAITILGVLTKLNMIVAAAALVPCLLLHGKIRWRKKILLAETGFFLIVLFTGWFFWLRISDGYLYHVMHSKLLGLNGALAVPVTVTNMLSFSPIRILSTLYNNNWVNGIGREYFWEYFFKSAFFGEWQFAASLFWLHWTTLLGGLTTLVLATFGLVRAARRKSECLVPLLSVLLTSFAFLFCYRLLYSAASNQDFRFVPLVAIPIAAFACIGLDALSPFWKRIGFWFLFGTIIACGLTLLTLPF